MPHRRRKRLRLPCATLLVASAWSIPAPADPLELPPAAHPFFPGASLGARVTDAEDTSEPSAIPYVPAAPLPRLELDDPLRGPSEEGANPALSLAQRPTLPTTLHPSWLQPSSDDEGLHRPAPPPLASWDAAPGPVLSPLSPLEPYAPTPTSTSSSANASPVEIDDRSGWARWNSTLFGVSVTVLTFDAVMVAAFTLLPTDVTGWHEPQFNGLRKNFTEGPRVDNDRFFFNYVAHPLAGSEYYLIARNRGCNWWQSAAYSAGMSSVFEFLIESTYEQASWQDLWITPVSGTVIGELRWQVKKALENPSTGKPVGILNKILYVVIDPFDAVYKL